MIKIRDMRWVEATIMGEKVSACASGYKMLSQPRKSILKEEKLWAE